MMLGSKVTEDKCQECGGDGSNCKTVEGVFDQTNLQVGEFLGIVIIQLPMSFSGIHTNSLLF